MTKRIKRKISLLLLNIQLLFTFFLPLSPLIPQALASEEAPFAIEQIEGSYSAYYLVDGVVFAESIDGSIPSFASESGEDEISYEADRLVIKTASQTYLLEDGKLVDQYDSDLVDLSTSDKNFLYDQWTVNGRLAETENEVELGVEYSFPLNKEVKVTFTKLPEERSTLRIEEVALPEELQEQLDTVSAYAYDITTDMNDGEFEFDLTLPVEEEVEEVEVKYAETMAELGNNAKEVEAEIELKDGEVKVEEVDHMTLFIVVKVASVGITLPFEGGDDNLGDVWMYRANAGANTDLITDPTGVLAEDLGTEVVYMNAPVLGRSFLGYTGFTGETLAETDLAEISWMKYADLTDNDHYLNLFMYKGIDWASVAIVPNCSGDSSWELCSTNYASITVRHHHFNTSGWPWNWHWETNTYNFASFSDLMDSSFGDWRLYNDSDTDSSLTIVSGSSTTDSDLLNYVDGVRFLYEDGSDDFYNFESEWDVTRATVSFSPVAPGFINSTWTVDIEFSEDVTDLGSSDLSLTNATVNSLTRIDESTFQVELASITDGTVSLQVPQDAVVDMAGHGNAVSDVYSYQVDTVAPLVAVTSPNGDLFNSDNVVIDGTVTDNASGIDRVQMHIASTTTGLVVGCTTLNANVSGSTWSLDLSTVASCNLVDDEYEVRAWAYDGAGNPGWSNRPTFVVDASKPTGRITSPDDGSLVLGGKTNIEGWASDNLSGIERVELRLRSNPDHSITRTPWMTANWDGTNFSGEIDTSSLPDGDYEVVAVAYDNAGNNKWLWPRPVIEVDNTAPAKPTGLQRESKDGSTIYQCGDFAQRQTLIPVWDDSSIIDSSFDHYEYSSFHPSGAQGLDERILYTNRLNHSWVPGIDGTYGFAVRAVDKAGNKSDWSESGETLAGSCQINYDTIAPSAVFTHYIDGLLFSDSVAFVNNINLLSFDGTYTDPEPSSLLKQDSFVIFDAQADGSFRFMANGAAAYCSWRTGANTMAIAGLTDSLLAVPFTNCTSDLGEGEYYMSHQVYDNAIRHDIPSITQFRDVLGLHFFIDQTLPLVSSTIDPVSPDGDNDWYITRPTVTITAEDPANLRINEITKIEYQWDSSSGTWTEYTSPVQPQTEGTHILYFRAFDKAGNESLMGQREVKWDQTDPTAPLSVDADPEVSGGPDVDVTWNDASDNIGIDRYVITFDNLDGDEDFSETVASNVNEFSTDGVDAAGTWRITVRAYDFAGNESASGSDDIVIDKTAPDAPVLSLGGTRDGEVDLSWTSIDDADSYIILYGLLPGDYLYAANVGDVTSYTVQGLGTGDYYFVVRAMDDSDNQSGNSNEVGTALVGVGGVIAEGFEDAENVLGVEDEATEEEQLAMIEEMGGEVAGANTCERARVWFWLGLAITFITVFFSAFLKKGWQKILAFILIPAIIAIVYSKFLGGACFNSSMMTWMNEVYWVPVYLTAVMAKLVTLFFVED